MGWTLVTLALLVAYPLSMGPVWWITSRTDVFDDVVEPAAQVVYDPIVWLDDHGPKWFGKFITWYLRLWVG